MCLYCFLGGSHLRILRMWDRALCSNLSQGAKGFPLRSLPRLKTAFYTWNWSQIPFNLSAVLERFFAEEDISSAPAAVLMVCSLI